MSRQKKQRTEQVDGIMSTSPVPDSDTNPNSTNADHDVPVLVPALTDAEEWITSKADLDVVGDGERKFPPLVSPAPFPSSFVMFLPLVARASLNPAPNCSAPSALETIKSHALLDLNVFRYVLDFLYGPVDTWDDVEGYYRFRPGDILDGKYEVFANQGSGVFSSVMRVRDITISTRPEFVIKVIRAKETMLKAGQKELEYLRLLADKDPDNRKHIVRLLGSFEHRGHLCMVFEPLYKNLRELLRKFGSVGLHISSVKSFAQQLLIALRHLRKCGILHGDIKPDNILVTESMKQIKLCDFGSAGNLKECEITPYLVSRFYRAPEVTLGMAYNEMVDLWSVGCVLFELYTGKILFPGRDSNDMLRVILEAKGAFPKKMLKKGMFFTQHFEENGTFLQRKVDDHSGLLLTEPRKISKPVQTIKEKLLAQASASDREQVVLLGDLLEKMLTVDPSRRITCEDALQHAFFKTG